MPCWTGSTSLQRTARYLRTGRTNAWLEVALHEGCNRQICRLLASCDVSIVHLVRGTVGPLSLGEPPKGQWQMLMKEELGSL
jgi:16S rRNA U516 pseudouridylate synthase RsuA-like enzyme